MSKVSEYDFGRYKVSMVERFGFSEEDCQKYWNDLLIIFRGMEDFPDKKYALTVGADQALHILLLDTVGHYRFSEEIFGNGSLVVHDPFAYGTPEFEIAWENTRAIFAAEGIVLPSDYTAAVPRRPGDTRRAEACFLWVACQADLRAAA